MRGLNPPTLALLLGLTVSPLPALGAERATAPDPRVRTLVFDPGQVYRIVGVTRTATQIVFSAEEEVLHVALGDSAGWEVAPQANVLFLKPKAGGRPTNLLVTTRRGAESRHYLFELVTRSGAIGRGAPDTYFQIRFSYPQDERAVLSATLGAEALALEQKVLQLKLDRGVLEGRRNLAYAVQGSGALQPSEASDNGRFTVLRFPANRPLPAIYAVSPTGAESLVPFDVRGEFVVIHQVVAQLRLRRGREMLCLYNEGIQPYGVQTGTGTAAGDVDRVDRPTVRR